MHSGVQHPQQQNSIGVKYQVSAAKVAANLLQQGINILTGLLPFLSSSSSSVYSTFFFNFFIQTFYKMVFTEYIDASRLSFDDGAENYWNPRHFHREIR